MSHNRPIGILGGTFDPPHFGHLRPALELVETLELDHMRLIPSHIPPHRPQPVATATQRLAMLQRACGEERRFQVDDRELQRNGPSYTLDTLRALREQWPDRPICFCLGMDALLGLPQWYHWQELTELAHIVVSYRPGWSLKSAELDEDLREWLKPRLTRNMADLQQQHFGHVWLQEVSQLAISATDIRRRIAEGHSPRFLMPEPVWQYIQQQQLYGVR